MLTRSFKINYSIGSIPNGIKTDTFGTFGKNNPTDGSTKRPIMKGEPKWSNGVK